MHLYKAGTPEERACFVELWDVGGSQFHRNSRRIFYQNADGIILVYDLTNKKSMASLSVWLAEVLDGLQLSLSSLKIGNTFDKEQFIAQEKPMLVVGTKADLINSDNILTFRSAFAVEIGAEEIIVNCRQTVSAGSNNRLKIDKFFDKVFAPCYSEDKYIPMASLLLERKRKIQ